MMIRSSTVKKHGNNRPRQRRSTTNLEFSECWLDPPRFRGAVNVYENEIEGTHKALKNLVKNIDDMIAKGKDFSEAQKKVNDSMLGGFYIGNIGELDAGETDIKDSLIKFSHICEEFRTGFDDMLKRIDNVKSSIHNFDEEHVKKHYKAAKKEFTRSSEKYYSSMHSGLQIGEGKAAQKQEKATENTKKLRTDFHRKSLDYVNTLQSVEEKKKYQLVEQFLLYSQQWSNWLTNSTQYLEEHDTFKNQIKRHLNALREKHQMQEQSTENLMTRHAHDPVRLSTMPSGIHEGHVLLMEKGFGRVARLENVRGVGNKWSHRYLKFDTTNKELILEHPDADQHKTQKFKVIPDHNKINEITTDRRFLFEVQVSDEGKHGELKSLNFQAPEESEYMEWLKRLGSNASGNPRVFGNPNSGKISHATLNLKIDDHIIERIQTAITNVESLGGIQTQGIYRLVGVQSKVDNLMQRLISTDAIDYTEYDIRTMTGAIKGLLRNFEEPILTFQHHHQLLDSIKANSSIDSRIQSIKDVIDDIPKENKVLLRMVCEHLVKIAAEEEVNKMSAQNLSVCFGPVFMWSPEESLAAIHDVKFQCSVIEHLIEKCDSFFSFGSETKLLNETIRENPFGLTKRTTSRSSLPKTKRDSLSRRSEYDNLSYQTFSQTCLEGIDSSQEHLGSINEENKSIDQSEDNTSDNLSDDESVKSKETGLVDELKPIPERVPIKDIHEAKRQTATDPQFLSATDPGPDPDPIQSEAPKPAAPTPILEAPTPISIEKSPILSMKKTKVRGQKSTQIKRTPTSGPTDRATPEIRSRTKTDISNGAPVESTPVIKSDARSSIRQKKTRARAKYKCEADHDDELSFEPDQEFFDVEPHQDYTGWFNAKREVGGKIQSGLVPGPFIEFIS